MGRKKRERSTSAQRLTKTVFCPMCDTMMKKVRTKPHQHGFDPDTKRPLIKPDGRPVLVSRVFYGCVKCNTVVWFDFREDGKVGTLHNKIKIQKMLGVQGEGLAGRFDGLV